MVFYQREKLGWSRIGQKSTKPDGLYETPGGIRER